MASNMEVFCEILIAILLPPLGVCLKRGCCTVEFLICLVLTILGYIPGIIYALYVIVFQTVKALPNLELHLTQLDLFWSITRINMLLKLFYLSCTK
ncbi:putative proteolipid membrane potential modulator [Arabidopsis thaliana]